MYSVYFLPTAVNACLHSENTGDCINSALYIHGGHDIPNFHNPNGTNPTETVQYAVIYFKYGYNLNSTRSPTYKVKFDNNDSQKWSCTCPDFISRRLAQQTCCKHIQGCIDIRQVDLLYPNLPVAIRFTPNYIKILRNHITRQ